MKNYKTILRLLVRDMLKKKDKKQTTIITLLAVLYLILAVLAIFMVYIYSSIMQDGGKIPEFITLILFIDFVMTIFFGTLAAMNFLFMSKDNEFFKALPVKQSTVFMAKLTLVFVSEALLSAAVLLPTLIFAGIFMHLPALFFCLLPVFALAVPVFALIFIAIISLPFMYIISMFKNRGAVSSIALIFVFVVGFGIYMYAAMSWGSLFEVSSEANYDALLSGTTTIAHAFYPVYMLAKFATLSTVFSLPLAASMAVEITIFLLSLVLMFAVSYFLCALVYNKTTGKLLENRARNVADKSHTTGTTLKTLMKLEWRGIIRNPGVAMQVVSGIALCPLIVFVFSMAIGSMGTAIQSAEVDFVFDISPVIWIMGIMSIMMFGVGINTGSVTCISREGQNINFLKTLPLEPKTIIKAKKYTYMLISGTSILSGMIAMTVLMIINDAFIWWMPIGGLAMTFVWLYAMTILSIYSDLKKPRLDWKNFREVIKRGKNNAISIAWVMINMVIGFALAIFAVLGILTHVATMLGIAFAALILIGAFVARTVGKKLDNSIEDSFRNMHI